MIIKKCRPERRFRRPIRVTRKEYIKEFFGKVLNENSSSGIQYGIKGSFYPDEIVFILRTYEIAPSWKGHSLKKGTYYCQFDIIDSTPA